MPDLVIRGATVYPGDAPPFVGDVGVNGGELAFVTRCHEEAQLVPRAGGSSTGRG